MTVEGFEVSIANFRRKIEEGSNSYSAQTQNKSGWIGWNKTQVYRKLLRKTVLMNNAGKKIIDFSITGYDFQQPTYKMDKSSF